ncbi:hypothetical protein JOC48_000874 [Aquibacillus albus]|uniref:Uncharacterized protein n=1 Tax=Aquibacillus albus TaxID=1168171 RepID=A0ABS2MWX0_9BACI|nr:hypothetical protein [Aquibacillus albus]
MNQNQIKALNDELEDPGNRVKFYISNVKKTTPARTGMVFFFVNPTIDYSHPH